MTWAIFSEAHVRAIGEILSSDPRILAVVGGALLDDTLKRTLSERLRNDSTMRDRLLNTNRPLGNAAPKNDLLYMLDAYDKRTWKAVDALISIRNFFAHHLDASFDSTAHEFVAAINKLNLHEGLTHYPLAKARTGDDSFSKNPVEKIINNRVKFLVNLKLALITLMRDRLSHETWSSRPLSVEVVDKKSKKKAAPKGTSKPDRRSKSGSR